jgi:shikimate kinase
MITDIVLIGPMRAGKSVLSGLLARALGVPNAPFDEVGMKYCAEAGLDPARAQLLRETEGELSRYRYFEQFLLPVLERYLRENRNCVIDLGAGLSVYWEATDFERAQQLLAPYRNVILILPSPDLDESAAVLRDRTNQIAWLNRIREQEGIDLNERFLYHNSNFDLAKFIVYTKGKTPLETAEEILGLTGVYNQMVADSRKSVFGRALRLIQNLFKR